MATSVGLEGFPVGTLAMATHFVQCPGGLGSPDPVRLLGERVGLPVRETAPAAGDPPQRRLVEPNEVAAVGGPDAAPGGEPAPSQPPRRHRPAGGNAAGPGACPGAAIDMSVGRRPRVIPGRTRHANVWLTDNEYALVAAAARRDGMTVGGYAAATAVAVAAGQQTPVPADSAARWRSHSGFAVRVSPQPSHPSAIKPRTVFLGLGPVGCATSASRRRREERAARDPRWNRAACQNEIVGARP
jgi:hypothetical protein